MKNTGKTIFYVTIITFLTKILVLFGNLLYGSKFGTDNIYVKIYTYASNFPNNIFVAVGTCLTTIVIPIYSTLKANNEKEKSKKFLDNIISISSILVILLIILSCIFAPLIVSFTAYKDDPVKFDYAVYALRVLFPIMFFFCLNYIFVGILQSNERFKLAAAVSFPSAVCIIFYIVFLGDKFGVDGLLFATLIGFMLQPILLLPGVLKTGYRYKFSFDLRDPSIKKSLGLVPSVLLGVSAYQINVLFNVNFSTNFGTEYSINLVQNLMLTPVQMIISSIASVYFPKISTFWGQNNKKEYKNSIGEVINILSFLLIPATIGIILLRYDIISILRWGNFSYEDGIISGNLLGCYALAIFFVGLKECLDKAFYAQQLTKPSALIGVIITISNISFSLLFREKLGTYSIPIAYSLSFLIGSTILLVLLIKKSGSLDKSIFINIGKCILVSLIMGVFVYVSSGLVSSIDFGVEFVTRAVKLGIPVLVGVLIYIIFGFIFKINLIRDTFSRFRKSKV